MRDVKALFRQTFVLQEITFAYFVAYIAAVFLWSHERSLLRLASQCILAGAVTAGVLAAAARRLGRGIRRAVPQLPPPVVRQ